MLSPWLPERTLSEAGVRDLLARRAPALADLPLAPLGSGWDNDVWRLGTDRTVRVPRRAVAGPLVEVEARVLGWLAPMLPLPVPAPDHLLAADEGFDWPVLIGPLLPGRELATAGLDLPAQLGVAAAMGRFLRTLHAVDPDEAARHGAPEDALHRCDAAVRVPGIRQRLREIREAGLIEHPEPFDALLTAAETQPWRRAALCHGDLHPRHVLVGPDGAVTGVIDWGDVHLGDPAVDLGPLLLGLEPPAVAALFAVYGPVDDRTWRLCRMRALGAGLLLALSTHEVGLHAIRDAAVAGLRRLPGLEPPR